MNRMLLSSLVLFSTAFPLAAHALPIIDGMSYLNFSSSGGTTGSVLSGTTASNNAIIGMQQVGFNTVALNVWDFTASTTSTAIAPDYSKYSSSDAQVQAAINYIHSKGMNVMIKPMLDLDSGTWRGQISPAAADVSTWFTNYDTFIDHYATIAQNNINNGVSLFSIGCELNGMEQYASDWTTTISSVRGLYSGPITYAANWSVNGSNQGGYKNISWWNQLDYVGIDAYFPLTNHPDPTEAQLLTAWSTTANTINSWRITAGLSTKQVLFTEAGYESRTGTNETPYGTSSTTQDIQEQADCYQALLQTMAARPWWQGVFWWDWTPSVPSAGNLGYSPEGKAATVHVLEAFNAPEPSSLALAAGSLLLLARRFSLRRRL